MKTVIRIFSNTFLLVGMYFLQQIRIELAILLLGVFLMFQKESELTNLLGGIITAAMIIMLLYAELGELGIWISLLTFAFIGFIKSLDEEIRKPTKF